MGFQYSFLLSWKHGQVIVIRDTVLIKYLTVNIRCCPLAQDCTRGRALRAGQLFHTSRCRTAGNLAPAACEGPSPLLGRISSLLWLLIHKWSWDPPQKGPSAQWSELCWEAKEMRSWAPTVQSTLSNRPWVGLLHRALISGGVGRVGGVLGAETGTAAPGNGAHRAHCHLALRCPVQHLCT